MRKSLFLTGFMGAGKTTTGRLLADLLGVFFVDLDDAIVSAEGRSIREIFAVDGEPYFRDLESQCLKHLKSVPLGVYATGGGIVTRAENRFLMKRLGKIVYLKSDWETLKQRLQQSTDRPLVDTDSDLADVKTLWLKRQAAYEDADLIIEIKDMAPQAVANKIVSLL